MSLTESADCRSALERQLVKEQRRQAARFWRELSDAVRREAAFQVICATTEIAADDNARALFAGRGLLVTMSAGFGGDYEVFLGLGDRHVYGVALSRARWFHVRRELEIRGLWPGATREED